MASVAALSETAALIGEPTRTAMVVALMDGRALTAGELAKAAGVAAPTASGHLSRLAEAGLISVFPQGARRYYRLASPAVAGMIEGMMDVAGLVAATRAARPIVTGPKDRALRKARVCFDHLAGELAVAIADSLAQSGHVEMTAEGASVTPQGLTFFAEFGLPGETPRGRGRVFCRLCMDWSERRPHLSGQVGRALLRDFVAKAWIRRAETGRAVSITSAGAAGFRRRFGVSLA
jgi:DNA-binding transcriptional ArsR family regulator